MLQTVSDRNTPPAPVYIFRGHTAAVHAVLFLPGNYFFVSGDADGYIIIWSLTTRRPVTCWKAHDGGIAALRCWQTASDSGLRLLSHGRDHKLRTWQISLAETETTVIVRTPVDLARGGDEMASTLPDPWLLHSMSINALNFCAFAICPGSQQQQEATCARHDCVTSEGLLLASPNGLDQGSIDLFQLPGETRLSKVQCGGEKTGMIMAVQIFWKPTNVSELTIVTGFEDGSIAIVHGRTAGDPAEWRWNRSGCLRVHSQPVLSLRLTTDKTVALTSSADAILAKVDLGTMTEGQLRILKQVNTKHAGQQDLTIRSDDRIFATAGWDKIVRVYSVKSLKEIAVLKWHTEGCYAVDFAHISPDRCNQNSSSQGNISQGNIISVRQRQADKIQNGHWIVAGSKDGKLSLWDVF